MDVAASTDRLSSIATNRRVPGPDVVRGVALIGVVVMNYHGYLILRGAERGSTWADELFDPWRGPLSTRFAATFVLVAGVSVTLMTQNAVRDPTHVTSMRLRLVRRGVVLYLLGLFVNTIWDGTILPYYGAMFILAAGLYTLSTPRLIVAGSAATLVGAWLAAWRFNQTQAGIDTSWLFSPDGSSPLTLVLNVFVNGTHPLFPWLAFFCAGMILGRVVAFPDWHLWVAGLGVVLAAVAQLVSRLANSDWSRLVLSTHPGSRSIVYVASALGTALAAYAIIDSIADRWPLAVDAFRRAGQMSLSLYLLHIVVFNFVVDWAGWVEPRGLGTALGFAAAFWLVGIALANAWSRRVGRGPAESLYRAITR